MVRAIDHVADALDALGDIVLAEGVHQLVMGNHARAAAVMSALGEGKAPPAPEVVETPRTGVTLTHRIMLPLADAAGAPAGWEAVPMTQRASAEPALNAWAAKLLGAPGDIRLRLVEAASRLPVGEVTVAGLGLHALDLVAILGPGLETGLGEIATRALDAHRPADLDDDAPPVPLQVDISSRASSWGGGVRTLSEVAPLIEAIGALIGRARAATAQRLAPVRAGAGRQRHGRGRGRAPAARGGRSRRARRRWRSTSCVCSPDDSTLDAASLPADGRKFVDSQQPAPDPPRWSTRDDWRAALLRAAAFGIPAALPPAIYQTRVQVRRALRVAAETAFAEIVQRLGRAASALSSTRSVGGLLDAAAAIFGSGLAILPRASLRNRAELGTALGAQVASATQIDGWLEGMAAVRESCAGLADLLALADAHGAPVPAAAVAQLPYKRRRAVDGRRAAVRRDGRRAALARGPRPEPAARRRRHRRGAARRRVDRDRAVGRARRPALRSTTTSPTPRRRSACSSPCPPRGAATGSSASSCRPCTTRSSWRRAGRSSSSTSSPRCTASSCPRSAARSCRTPWPRCRRRTSA